MMHTNTCDACRLHHLVVPLPLRHIRPHAALSLRFRQRKRIEAEQTWGLGGRAGEGGEELNDAGRMLRATCHTGNACTLRLDIVRVTRKVRGVGVHGVKPRDVGGQAVEVVAAGWHACAWVKGGKLRALLCCKSSG